MLPSANPFKLDDFYDNLQANVGLKRDAGFEVQYTDPWSIALAQKFGPGGTSEDTYFDESETKNNIGTQWGDIRNVQAFKDADMSFPVVVACSRPPGFSAPVDKLENYFIPLDSNVYEFNPFE
jgi:lysophospholipase